MLNGYQILLGDCLSQLKTLVDGSINCCVTSPPYYGLRDYGMDEQIGLEETPELYIQKLVEVFREVRRVLRDDGTLWVNIGDSYAARQRQAGEQYAGDIASGSKGTIKQGTRKRPDGYKEKDLIGIPWMLAFALRADGWYLRQDIIWSKPNAMPESVRDRCTKSHEYVFLLSKSQKYFYNHEAIKEPAVSTQSSGNKTNKQRPNADALKRGAQASAVPWEAAEKRNRRDVWNIPTRTYKGAHFATFPPALVEPCILAGCPSEGKRCDCDEIISTPTGSGEIIDPSMLVGRAGMSRPRKDNEGIRPVTRRQQRHHAYQLKNSPHRLKIEEMCGTAFAHYIRTDRSGARPLPVTLMNELIHRGWITNPDGECEHLVEVAGTVLDPFGGSGTTAGVSLAHGRKAVICELNPEYAGLIPDRINSIIASYQGGK